MTKFKVYVERTVYQRGSVEVEAATHEEARYAADNLCIDWNNSNNPHIAGPYTEYYYDYDDPNYKGFKVTDVEEE